MHIPRCVAAVIRGATAICHARGAIIARGIDNGADDIPPPRDTAITVKHEHGDVVCCAVLWFEYVCVRVCGLIRWLVLVNIARAISSARHFCVQIGTDSQPQHTDRTERLPRFDFALCAVAAVRACVHALTRLCVCVRLCVEMRAVR